MPPPSPNRRLVEVVARRLGPIRQDVALVGGTSVEFLLTDPAAPEVRPTQDVDLIVEARTYAEYVSRFADRLRERGFLECSDRDAPMCRWVVEGVRVDFMPTGEEALGFTNRWYAPALAASDRRSVGEGLDLRVVTAPYSSGSAGSRLHDNRSAFAGSMMEASGLRARCPWRAACRCPNWCQISCEIECYDRTQ